MKDRVLLFCLVVGLSGTAAGAGAKRHGAADMSPRAQPHRILELQGYLEPSAQTLVLFETEAAARAWDATRCKNVGSSARYQRNLVRRGSKNVRLTVEDLGTRYAELYRDMGNGFMRVRGRVIDIFCDDPHLYWVVEK